MSKISMEQYRGAIGPGVCDAPVVNRVHNGLPCCVESVSHHSKPPSDALPARMHPHHSCHTSERHLIGLQKLPTRCVAKLHFKWVSIFIQAMSLGEIVKDS